MHEVGHLVWNGRSRACARQVVFQAEIPFARPPWLLDQALVAWAYCLLRLVSFHA